nr:hypothetical protein [uncultured Agathobaculum sp.]
MKRYFACLAVLLTALLAACGETVSPSIEGAAYIELQSGNTGELVTITDADTVAQITADVNALRLRDAQEIDSTGWSYRLRWYDADGAQLAELLPHGWRVDWNGMRYQVAGTHTVDTDALDDLLGA